MGGEGNDNSPGNSAELYDPATGTWTPTGSLAYERNRDYTATLLTNGEVLVVGGQGQSVGDNAISSVELYNPGMSTAALGGDFTSTGSLNDARYLHTATLLPNGQVLVAGGFNYNGSNYVTLASAELYDPATGAWALTGSLNDARGAHTATLLPNGQVLVAGGGNDDGNLASAELYDPATGTWTYTGSPDVSRGFSTATLLANGQVLIAGGDDGGGDSWTGAELYDPVTGTWSNTGSMTTPRELHTATRLPNGQVLVAGGEDPNLGYYLHYGITASADLYDPATGTWTPTGNLAHPRYDNTATLLPNGQVLVAGYNLDNGGDAELYDPATGAWSLTGSLATERYYYTATLLPSGKVLAAGGEDPNGARRSAELYDPATGTWSPTGGLGTERYAHTATLLPNGQVLVAGGIAANGNGLAGAELYNPGVSLPNPVKLGDGSFQFGFINGSGPSYSVLANTNLSATVNTWTNLGAATEMPVGSGLFQFTDHQAPNYPQRFYRVSLP